MNVGKKVNVVCDSITTPTWYKGELSFPVYKGRTLSFDSVRKSDEGYYKCRGQYDNRQIFVSRVHIAVGKQNSIGVSCGINSE